MIKEEEGYVDEVLEDDTFMEPISIAKDIEPLSAFNIKGGPIEDLNVMHELPCR